LRANTLKGVIHYRKNVHEEWDLDYEFNTALPSRFTGRTPTEKNAEEDVVLAVEDTFHATRYLDFVTGISYDRNEA
jgi:iron complex outermembrane receptor protein